MRERVLRRDEARAPEREAPASPPPAPAPLAEFAAGVGNQAFAQLARSSYEGGPEPDLGGYNAAPNYDAADVEPAFDRGADGELEPHPAANPALGGDPENQSINVRGEAKSSAHYPLPLDSPEATGESVPAGATVADVGGGEPTWEP